MSAPHDWPAPGGTAGGCACDYCGVIYIGPEWQDGCCAECARDSDTDPKGGDGTAPFIGSAGRDNGIAQTPSPSSDTPNAK